MASTFILTSAPLLLSQVPLASFVPDVGQPYADTKRIYTVSQSDYSVRPETTFTGLVSKSSGGLLNILATKFVNLLAQRERESTFRVEAENGRIYTLDNPDDLFTAILASEEHGDELKQWLERWKRRGQAPRFVVGYRTFIDARVARSEHASHYVGGGVSAPVSALSGDLSGTADVKVSAAHKAGHKVQGQAVLPGERIYAIAYRKIRVMTRKGVLTVTADIKTKWEPFSGERGRGRDESVHFEADVSTSDDDEDCKVFVIDPPEGGDGEVVRIGLLNEDDSGEDEDVDTSSSE
ncbi:hypothetical protein F5X98DRAFT_305089 [Xylaria grammica]|nr:hypothetical protein F5X98DRAFT_305089 [Xylaria grammica]